MSLFNVDTYRISNAHTRSTTSTSNYKHLFGFSPNGAVYGSINCPNGLQILNESFFQIWSRHAAMEEKLASHGARLLVRQHLWGKWIFWKLFQRDVPLKKRMLVQEGLGTRY